jgi:alkanesulfonate monooxygenase SsuD/methylene tetrahydromethanopterin reductase-like flavin-dependent oxidoreductase (luciferase family)
MKFGVMQLVSGGYGRTEAECYRDNLEVVQLAEELGFHSVWVAEHHFTDYGLVPNTLQYLAAAAALTERIRLGAAVVVTPLHNPIRIAEEAAFVDVLSGGRLDLGLGRGYQPKEYGAFGMSMEESRARFEESVAFLHKAFTSTEPFDWDGQFYKGTDICILPRVAQEPYPPLWFAAVSASTFEMAGENGWQILTSPNFTPVKIVADNFEVYRAALTKAGHQPENFLYPVMQQVYCGADPDRAYDEPQEACMNFFSKLSALLPKEIKDSSASGGESYEQFRKTQRKISDLRYDYLYENAVLFGDPERLIARIRDLHDATGLDYLIGWFNLGSLDAKLAKDSLRRFAEEVMPAFPDDEIVATDDVFPVAAGS